MEKKKRINLVSSAQFIAHAEDSNPNLGWLEFILTDDEPNKNAQGIKQEEFSSLIKTGILMPMKMAIGTAESGHEDAAPLGTISALKIDGNKVSGRAAIWKSDRENDYNLLTTRSAAGKPIDISWEIVYYESVFDENNVEWLKAPILLGAAIVGEPAYSGRTPVISVASGNGGQPDANTDGDVNATLANTIINLESEMEELEDKLSEAVDKIAELTQELEDLRSYKEEREVADARAELLASRFQSISDAGIEVASDERKEDFWLGLNDDAFETVLSMLKEKQSASASLPDLSGTSGQEDDIAVVRTGLLKMREGK